MPQQIATSALPSFTFFYRNEGTHRLCAPSSVQGNWSRPTKPVNLPKAIGQMGNKVKLEVLSYGVGRSFASGAAYFGLLFFVEPAGRYDLNKYVCRSVCRATFVIGLRKGTEMARTKGSGD